MTIGTEHSMLTLGSTEVPTVRVTGARPGPLLTVIAGVHGCEVSAIAALRAFVHELDAETMSGTLLAAPIVNLAAFRTRTPFLVPGDGKNLNRCFPGDPDGTEAERIAHDITTSLMQGSDAFIDMHAGDQVEALEPFTLFEAGAAEDEARRIAVAYGLGYVIRQQAGPDRAVSGSSSMAAAALGIPAITAEAGGCGLVTAAAVDLHKRGLHGVLAALGMLPAAAGAPPEPVVLDRFLWLRCARAGWWSPMVEPGEQVAAGDLLGTVATLDGSEVLERIVAPAAGVPMFITTSPAVDDDGLLLGLGAPAAAAEVAA